MQPSRRWIDTWAVVVLVAAVVLGAPSASADAERAAAAALEGKVVDRSGEPVAGAMVTLRRLGEGGGSATSTDAEGRFRFARVVAGRHTLNVMHSDFAAKGAEIEVGAAVRPIEVILAPRSAAAAGRATTSAAPSRRVPEAERREPAADRAAAGSSPSLRIERLPFAEDFALQTWLRELPRRGRRLESVQPLAEGESLFVTLALRSAAAAGESPCRALPVLEPIDPQRIEQRMGQLDGMRLAGIHRLRADAYLIVACSDR